MEDDPKPPFPRVPGELRYRVGPDDNRVERGRLPDPERTFAEMRLERPPGWVMATLRALHRGVTPDEKPPRSWRKEFNEPNSNTALRDFGSDFGLSLRHDPHPDWPDVWYDTRGEHPQKISEDEAMHRLWSGHSRIVLVDLNEWGERVAATLKRIDREWKSWAAWQARANARQAAQAEVETRAQAAAFARRETWQLGAVLYWAAFLDVARAMLAERENPGMIVAKATWKNSIDFHIAADRIGGADVVELNPWGRLVRALRDGDVIALGRFMGASGVDPIPAREWQGNALHLCESEGGFVCAAALTFDIEAGPHWRALVFDRASVLRTFPPRPSDPLFAATEPVAAIDATAQITEPPPSNTAGDSLRTRLTLARDFIGPVGEGEQIYLSFVWRYLAKHGHSPGRRIKEQIAERLRAEYGRRINQGGTCPAALRQALEERISAE